LTFSRLFPGKQRGYFQHGNEPIRLNIRSTGFERFLAANMLFVPMTSNSFKPFVARLQQGTNGVFHLSITPKEFEDSQK
jgi:hypothetical protein